MNKRIHRHACTRACRAVSPACPPTSPYTRTNARTHTQEKVAEEREHGYAEKEASTRALAATANLISAAGLIMVTAFLSVLLSSTTALNEIAFMLTIGILIDCFVTTKIIIPATIGLTGRLTFWPRAFKVQPEPEAEVNRRDVNVSVHQQY